MAVNSKSIGSRNSTVPVQSTTTVVTEATPISSTLLWDDTTVASPTTTSMLNLSTTAAINNDIGTTSAKIFTDADREEKPYEFQSNFTRNNDSVFVSLHSSASVVLVSINNTFNHLQQRPFTSEIQFHEQIVLSNRTNSVTNIVIRLNETLTREIAIQLGDRLIDIAELLSTVHLLANQTDTANNR